ncbi:hypothetical protein ACIQAL_09900 [Pseudomonas sp. NPDC088368]|jgi:hypothetical protein|uniref:hypothetical protein n=1 Tax=Pseudomonas sp. NPDC088368 TaxID=3364453 RepID=UPI0038307224
MNKKLLPLALVFVSMSGMAGEFSVTKSKMPYRIVVSPGAGGASFPIGYMDTRPRAMYTLESIDWSTTGFPQSVGERVELCYASGSNPDSCEEIAPNSSGTSYRFKGELFRPGSIAVIRHWSAAGGARNSQPSGEDRVRFNLSY